MGNGEFNSGGGVTLQWTGTKKKNKRVKTMVIGPFSFLCFLVCLFVCFLLAPTNKQTIVCLFICLFVGWLVGCCFFRYVLAIFLAFFKWPFFPSEFSTARDEVGPSHLWSRSETLPCKVLWMHLEYMVFQIQRDRFKKWIQSWINEC